MNIFQKYKGKTREEIPDEVWELILTVGNIDSSDRQMINNPEYFRLPTSSIYGKYSKSTAKEINKELNKLSKEFTDKTRKPYEH